MTSTRLWTAAINLLAVLAFVPIDAEAAITSVTVTASRDYEQADDYTYAEITVKGSVTRPDRTVGQYSVPAVIIYPRNRCGNGVGVVDWLNSAFYHFFPPTTELGTAQFTLLATGQHLFDKGYTYVSIQWDKAVTEIFGPAAPADGQPHNRLLYGSIDRSADAWEILLDAARLLKNPGAYPGPDRPQPVATVLSSGYSQGGALQLEMLAEGLDPTRVYDGHLVQMIGLACWKRDDVAPHYGFLGDCGALPVRGRHARVMVLTSETDMVAFHPTVLPFGKSAFFTRNPANPSWRQYEMAGVSHLPEPILAVGTPNQNTADASPIFRAAFDNLARWTRRHHPVTPPAARYFAGHVDGSDAFVPILDADGHFTGGVRLPHVESTANGHLAGAPLGSHRPLNPLGQDPFDAFKLLGGSFACFSDEQVFDRYGSHRHYIRRVKRAADELVAGRYITYGDWWALLVAAVQRPFPPGCVPGDDDGNDLTPGTGRKL